MPLFKQPKSKFWWCRFRPKGWKKEVRQSTRTTNRRLAQIEEIRLRAAAEMSRPCSGPIDFEYLASLDIDRSLSEGADERRAYTIQGLWKPLKAFFVADEKITTHRIREFIIWRRNTGARAQTYRRELQALRRGLRLAELPCPTEWPKIRKDPPKPSLRGKLHDLDTIKAWLALLPPEARDESVFTLHTGVRAYELKRIRWEMVEDSPTDAPTKHMLRLPPHATKTRTERIIGLSTEAYEILKKRKRFSNENHRKSREAASKRLGLPMNVTLRDLRHVFSTWALQGTGDAAAVQAAMGHHDLRTTALYQSSTICRTLGASEAVVKAFLRIPDAHTPKDHPDNYAKVWRAMRGSNPRPSAPESVSEFLDIISACTYRLAVARQWLEIAQSTPGVRIPDAHTKDEAEVA